MSIQTTTLTGQSSNPPVENAQQVTRVLVVDDEVGMRALSCAIIKSLGFQAIAVNTGEEAIETYRQHLQRSEPISAVIMDLALPGGMSGLETTDLLRQMDSSVAVIASSGYLQQNARAAALERGFAVSSKPYTPERLTAELRWVITRR